MKHALSIPSIHLFEVDSKNSASQVKAIDNRQRTFPFLNYKRLSWLSLILLTALSPLQAYAAPPIKVTYNGNGANGGSVPVDGTSYTSGGTVTVLPPGSLTRSGHLFSHWDTALNDSGADYEPGNTFSITSSVDLYAQWKPIDPTTPTGVMPLSGGTKWALCFSDEFKSANLNTSKWGVDVSATSRAARPTQGIDSWYWKSENVSLDGTDNLVLAVTKANSSTMYCGSVSSDGLFEPRYGYLEARIQIADTRKSTHTAFWLQGPNMNNSDPADGTANDGAEVDIFESAWFGDYTKSVVHYDGYDADHRADTRQYTTPGLHSGYHVFGLEWTSDSMKIYYDGVLKVTYTGIKVPQVPEWLWLSCGASFGDVGTFISEPIGLLTSAKVDYVRVWEPVPNVAPVFASDPISGANATENAAYSGTLAGLASDANNDPLTFAKVSGPTWLSVAANGSLSGTPTNSNVGANSFTVSVSDGIAAAVQAQLSISVSSAPTTYLVNYHSNNATSGTVPSNQTKDHNVAITLATNTGNLARTGYTLAGWNIQADGLGTSYAEGASYTANAAVTLYAKWTPNNYTVTFDPNGGGTPNPQTKQVTFGSTYGALATVSRTGYSFDGWFTAASGGTQVTSASNVTITANQTLHAQWTLIPVSVVTNTGAVGVPEGSTTTFQVKLSNQPVGNTTVTVARSSGDTDISIQSGGSLSFTTANWDTYQTVTLAAAIDGDAQNGTSTITCTPSDPAFISAQVTATEVDKDTTLTVASGGNGSTGPSGAIIVVKGATTAISATANAGYDFVNWTVPSGSATLGNANSASTTASITAPATVQANFAIRQYTLTYTAGTGGTITGASPQTVNHGANGSQVTAVPNSGYSFVKWSDNVLTASRTDTSITSNLSVAAEFSANTYDVVFDANGGTAAVPSGKQVTFAAPYGTLATTSRTGYSFNGWFAAASGGTEVTSATTVSTASNHTLYAQWTPDTYTVTYNGNGNTTGTAPANDDKIHDVDLTLATNSGNLTKTGYSFAGWNTALDGSGADYAAGATYTGNAALTLYAKWVAGADGTWAQTAAGPFDWGTTANWSGSIVASGSDRTAFFTPNITATQVVNLEAPYTIGNITFTDSTSSNNLTISGANALTLSRSSGTPVIDVTQSGRTLTISSQISGSNGLKKDGTGILTLSGTNDYTGGTVISAGSVNLGTNSDANLGATTGGLTFTGNGNITYLDNLVLNANRSVTINPGASVSLSNAITVNGILTGSGAFSVNTADGFRFMNDSNGFSGEISANTGNNLGYGLEFASIGDGVGAGLIKLNNGSFRWISNSGTATTFSNRQFVLSGTTSGATISALGGAGSTLAIAKDLLVTGDGNKTLTLAGTNTGLNRFSGNIANGNVGGTADVISLTKTEGGTWALSGTNTYSGDTNLAASGTTGRLVFQGSQSLSANTKLIFAQASSNLQSVSFLDDGTGTINFARPIEFGGTNTSQNLNIFVGNNNTANGGSSTGTTTGSTIQVGGVTFTSIAGDTNTTTINATGANNYRLETGTITLNNLVTRAAGSTTVTALKPTTANMTVAAITMATGNTGTLNDGVPVVRLDGTSTDNHVTGAVSDASDYLTGQALSLQKQNSSTWTLSGANTYTGTTTVSAGKLFINGDSTSATGAVSVAANATLGGTGIIGGNTTIAATGKLEFDLSTAAVSHNKLELAASKTLTFSGASVLTITSSGGAQIGTYTLLTSPGGISGVAPATLNLPVGWAATVSIVGNDLRLDVTSVGSLVVDHFAISSIASPQTVGTPIAGITITAQDVSDLTVTSFTGTVTFGGTAGITGTSASFVAGVLTGVSVTPANAGTNLTLTVNDGSGHTGSATFTVRSVFDDWASGSGLAGGDAVMTANPDGDSLTNLQEFAFGMDPTSPVSNPLVYQSGGNVITFGSPILQNFAATGQPADYRAVFARRKDHSTVGLTYTVQFSADLGLWTPSATAPTLQTGAGSAGSMEVVSVPFPATVPLQVSGSAPPKFFRMEVMGD